MLKSGMSEHRILTDWKDMVNALRHPNKEVDIALVGKYIQLHDAYLSVVEALKHGGIAERATVNIHWVDSEELNEENVDEVLGSYAGYPGSWRFRQPWCRRKNPCSKICP